MFPMLPCFLASPLLASTFVRPPPSVPSLACTISQFQAFLFRSPIRQGLQWLGHLDVVKIWKETTNTVGPTPSSSGSNLQVHTLHETSAAPQLPLEQSNLVSQPLLRRLR